MLSFQYLIFFLFGAVIMSNFLEVDASEITHCSEFVCRDFFLAFCNCVEEQVLQTRQDARLPSPTGKQHKKHTDDRVRKKLHSGAS